MLKPGSPVEIESEETSCSGDVNMLVSDVSKFVADDEGSLNWTETRDKVMNDCWVNRDEDGELDFSSAENVNFVGLEVDVVCDVDSISNKFEFVLSELLDRESGEIIGTVVKLAKPGETVAEEITC